MRVVRVQPVGEAVLGDGPLRIGSASDDDVALSGAGVAQHHAMLVADARGVVLTVQAGCQRLYVNARAVRERALLRHGDTLTVGVNKILVATDAPPRAGEPAVTGVSDGRAVLRIVSGAASGQALAVSPGLELGAGGGHFRDLAYSCRVQQTGGGLLFESDDLAAQINGWPCRRAWLSTNDQIVLGKHRLVVEAPGLQYAAHVATLPPVPQEPPSEVQPDASVHGETRWLIAAAAVLAVLIAFFLYFRW